jgi:hypothetical protein
MLMAGPIFVFKGESPFFMGPPESVKDDLLAVSGLTEDQTDSLIDSLKRAKGFLSLQGLKSVVQGVLGKEKTCDSVVRVLWNIEADDLLQILNRFEEELKDNFEGLKTKLEKLTRSCPALDKYRKARRLASATGQQLEDVQIICDLRPIFDEARENIEGMIPCTILRIVAEGTDGLSAVSEVNLSATQVYELADKAAKAKKKLERLTQHVKEWNPEGLPDLPSTRLPKGEK